MAELFTLAQWVHNPPRSLRLLRERSCAPPERIPSQPFLDLMNARGVPWNVVDLPAYD